MGNAIKCHSFGRWRRRQRVFPLLHMNLSFRFAHVKSFTTKCTSQLNSREHLSIVSQICCHSSTISLRKSCIHGKNLLGLVSNENWKTVFSPPLSSIRTQQRIRVVKCIRKIKIFSRCKGKDGNAFVIDHERAFVSHHTTGRLQNEIKEHKSKESAKWKIHWMKNTASPINERW